MTEEVIKFMNVTFGVSATVVFIALIAIGWLIHYITKKTTKIEDKHDELINSVHRIEDNVDKKLLLIDSNLNNMEQRMDAKINNIEQRMDAKIDRNEEKLNNRIDSINSKINDIQTAIITIKGSILSLCGDGSGDMFKSHSPLSLTEKGQAAAKEMHADDIISRNWNNIDSAISEVKEQAPYDIQQFCIETILFSTKKFLSDEDIRKIKSFAYNHGKPLQTYLQILAILIRDKYLKEHNIVASVDLQEQV